MIDQLQIVADLTDNLANLNSVFCNKCMEQNKKLSQCCYTYNENNHLVFKCNECHNKTIKPSNLLKEKFSNTYRLCDDDLDKFMLLIRKGVYPYEYTDSDERIKEITLPPIEKCYSNLYQKHISDKDYEHAKNVWSTFNIENIEEYHDLYVQVDTLLLSDIFENFRDMCLDVYELDPAYFVSVPGLAWQACLKTTNIKLELLTDIDMSIMFEKRITGGISQAIHRYAKANNKYMKNYNKNILSSYLLYLHANNLYGWAIRKKVPVDNFQWAKNLNIYSEDFIKRYDENSEQGYLLEVDIEYPKELAKLHEDLTFLPERGDKLYATLQDKYKHVVHISTLKQALNHGLKLKKVHRVIKFTQKTWMKKYFDKNTKLRTNAKNNFEKDLFKLMNNSVFGKTMGNVRNPRDIKLVVTYERRKKLASEPNYHTCKQFDDNLIAIDMRKTEVYMNKPIYLGQMILDLSKTLMYEFYYDYLKLKFRDKIKIVYMDTFFK